MQHKKSPMNSHRALAESTGLEPAASGLTGRRSNQLNYDSSAENLISSDRAAGQNNFYLLCTFLGTGDRFRGS